VFKFIIKYKIKYKNCAAIVGTTFLRPFLNYFLYVYFRSTVTDVCGGGGAGSEGMGHVDDSTDPIFDSPVQGLLRTIIEAGIHLVSSSSSFVVFHVKQNHELNTD